MLQCQIITSELELQPVIDEWSRLQEGCGQTPFTSPAWFQTWWRNIGCPKGKKLHIIVGRVDKRLVAVLPLTTLSKKGIRVLQGAGTESLFPCEILSERPEYVPSLWQAAFQSRDYDFALIKDVEAGSESEQALKTFAYPVQNEKVPFLSLTWSSSRAWIESLPSKMQREQKRCQRRLQEKGEVQYHTVVDTSVPEHIVDGMIRQKAAWCAEHGLHGFFDHPGVGAFFHQWLKNAAEAKQLLLGWLQCGSDIVAYNLGFSYKGVFYGYLVTNDPAWASFSPGNLTITNAISWAIDNGCREFNFMQGGGGHKLRYTEEARDYAEWTFSRSLSGRLKAKAFLALRDLQFRIKNIRTQKNFKTRKTAVKSPENSIEKEAA